MLLHVLDCATLEPGRDPISDLDAVEAELAEYVSPSVEQLGELLDRPRLVALNKLDVPEAAELAALVRPELEARGLTRVRGVGGEPRRAARAVLRAGRGGAG